MRSLNERMIQANTLLQLYAVPHEGTLGRAIPEDPDATRFPFQRDRDRIIHSRSFRRLKGKTQVFVSGVGDHYRTRLTHTMEVAQISRDMARTLGVNEDLVECIALAHDVGHPPFGHAGEDALNDWMERHGSSFEHNRQSLRIITTLASRSSHYTGLNLNVEILEGIMKHRTPFDEGAEGTKVHRQPSLEAQIVNIADEIAYTGHDIDDGLRAGLFSLDDLSDLSLTIEAGVQSKKNGTKLRGALIHILVMDLYTETEQQLQSQKIATLDDVYRNAGSPVRFSENMREKLDALRTFLWENMYMHSDVQRHAIEGKKIVTDLCDHFLQQPSQKITTLMKENDSKDFEAVKDYVAGMTDAFAFSECERIENSG